MNHTCDATGVPAGVDTLPLPVQNRCELANEPPAQSMDLRRYKSSYATKDVDVPPAPAGVAEGVA